MINLYSTQRCWEAAFTTGHIITGFQDTGLIPVNGTKVLAKLRDQAPATNTPRYPDSLPTVDRFSRAKYAAGRLAAKAHHFSSDTDDALSYLQAVANEAIILRQRVAQEQKNKEKRLQRASRYKVRMSLKSKDNQLQTANTLEDMRTAYDAKQAFNEELALYQQEKFVRDTWYGERAQAINVGEILPACPTGLRYDRRDIWKSLVLPQRTFQRSGNALGRRRRPIHKIHSHGSSIKGQFLLEIQVPRSILPWIQTPTVLSAYACHDLHNQPHLPPQQALQAVPTIYTTGYTISHSESIYNTA